MRLRCLERFCKWLACVLAVWPPVVSAYAAGAPGTVELSPLPLDRSPITALTPLALSSSVLAAGTLAFMGGYDPDDWSGRLQAVVLDADGGASDVVWDAAAMLTDPLLTPPAGRTLLTASRDASGTLAGIAFEPRSAFDDYQKQGLLRPEPELPTDGLQARVDYLRGIRTLELNGGLRRRGSVLGAIMHAQLLYVGYPTGKYASSWPSKIQGTEVPAPEIKFGAQSYARFVAENANRVPMLYVAANDGMLHAFRAPVPVCKKQDANGRCVAYEAGPEAGRERWAYVPRAAYGNLGILVRARGFQFQPSVDATPVTRDVFFSQHGRREWRSLLVGGLRLGGRGVYALDITKPDTASEAYPERTVLWEFDAASPAGKAETGDSYDPADLGYTYGQPAIARLANGRWAVLVPGGYFPDCSKPDRPAHCVETQPPGYSPLFVLDAQTDAVIAELKTPTLSGVTSYGLTTPVLGDYDNDQVDDVAFAGDLAGNLWRFDLSAPDPSKWKVSLAYRPPQQGAQPITVMPRLFPDPATHRFMVVFGTGKYLGMGDKRDTSVQSIYGVRDWPGGVAVTRDKLVQQTLHEEKVTDEVTGATARLRTLSSNALPARAGGWYIDLDGVPGERVIATPTALFDANIVLVSSLIPDGDSSHGALMAIDAATGGPRSIVGFGGRTYAGGLLQNAPSGTLPVAARLGGGKLILPGIKLKTDRGGLQAPLSIDGLLWRRRSWTVLTPDS